MLKRLVIMVMFVFLFMGFLTSTLHAEPTLTLEAEGAVLIDPSTGRVLFEQDADKKWFPASMTKIMTMGLVLEALEAGQVSLGDQVLTSENAAGYGGTQVYLEPGEIFTLEEMLIAIAVGSANDASVAVAEFFSGTEEAFAKLMTAKAKELGATNTNFINSHGLHHDDHYTTPKDMALISRWAMSFPKMQELTSIKSYTFREEPKLLILYNTNKLLWWYPGTTGLKTGTTSAAKRNLTATAERNGVKLLSSVMGVGKQNGHFGETMKLLNWGFANFKFEKFFSKGDIVTEIKVSKGVKDTATLSVDQQVGVLLEKQEKAELETKFDLPQYLPAPVVKGQTVGFITVLKDKVEVAKVPVLTAEDIPKNSFWQLFSKVLIKSLSL
ncbi:MAG: D-alanyl-D-alanine carboxypeptidase family protein [Bacillota bacterium]